MVVGDGGRSPSLSGGAIGGIVAGAVIAVIIALGVGYLLLRRNRSRQTPGAGAHPPKPTYIMPPADSILAAEGKPTSPSIAPTGPIYTTEYTTKAYEADGKQTYEADGTTLAAGPTRPTVQVYEAGGIPSNRYELPGR